jgi:3-hydroxybutyrate dehydrogenase
MNDLSGRRALVTGDGQAAAHGLAPEAVVEQILLAKAAIRRLIEPEEVAELVAYLCSPQASMRTGTSVALDGGWTAH